MEHIQALQLLKSIGQEHLLSGWPSLSGSEQKELLQNIAALNLAFFKKQRELITLKNQIHPDFKPYKGFSISGNQKGRENGLLRIAQGKTGCLIVAGGQGTRLGWDGPKGAFPITLIKHKSLFQLFAEKIRAAGMQAGRKLPFAIMTSPLNDEATRLFFREHHYFGIDPKQVDFFTQSTLPFLDEKGDLFLESPAKIAQGPAGNGLSLKHFWENGIGPKWKSMGIEEVIYIPIDNPLADPFDAELIGFHHENNYEATLKCTERTEPSENVGVLVEQQNHLRVIEYTELSDEEKAACDDQGKCKFSCANLSLFCFQLDFIENVYRQFNELPLHVVKKPSRSLHNNQIEAWKFEFFIFDVLFFARKTGALLYPKERCFAPLKNKSGKDSIETVRTALQNLDRQTFSVVSGMPANGSFPFELAQEFYYPTPSLISKWKGEPLPSCSYIEP